MGGKLLNLWNLSEKRVPRAEFEQYTAEILELINRNYSFLRAKVIPFFSEKESFGDMDLLVEVQNGRNPWYELAQAISGFEPHKNGNVISFPYKGFQVDFITVGSESFDSALTYFSYETGNFMGRIADKLGFKYGHNGLFLHVPLSKFDSELPDHQYKDIPLTKNPVEIFDILGFNYESFLKGFKNEDEMYLWVAAARYFIPQNFAFEELNSINRTRNRKRPVYARFVEWCKRQPEKKLPSQEVMFQRMINRFPHLNEEIDKIHAELELNKDRRAKFNGNLVKEMFGLEGKELGEFIVGFKHAINDDFLSWLDRNTAEFVRSEMTHYYVKNMTDGPGM